MIKFWNNKNQSNLLSYNGNHCRRLYLFGPFLGNHKVQQNLPRMCLYLLFIWWAKSTGNFESFGGKKGCHFGGQKDYRVAQKAIQSKPKQSFWDFQQYFELEEVWWGEF